MIILDTNVISEVMRGPAADPGVLTWIRTLADQPVTTVINRAEVMAGVALLPAGHRRAGSGRRPSRPSISSASVCR